MHFCHLLKINIVPTVFELLVLVQKVILNPDVYLQVFSGIFANVKEEIYIAKQEIYVAKQEIYCQTRNIYCQTRNIYCQTGNIYCQIRNIYRQRRNIFCQPRNIHCQTLIFNKNNKREKVDKYISFFNMRSSCVIQGSK